MDRRGGYGAFGKDIGKDLVAADDNDPVAGIYRGIHAQGTDLVRGDACREKNEVIGRVLGYDAVHGVLLAAMRGDHGMVHPLHHVVIGHDDTVAPVEKTSAVALARAADEDYGGSDFPVEILGAEREHAFRFLRVEFHDGSLGGILDPFGKLVLPAPTEELAQGREMKTGEAARDDAEDEHKRKYDTAAQELPQPPVKEHREQDRDVKRPPDEHGRPLRHLDCVAQHDEIAKGEKTSHDGENRAEEKKRTAAEGLP